MTNRAFLARQKWHETLSAQMPLGTFFHARKRTHNIPARQSDIVITGMDHVPDSSAVLAPSRNFNVNIPYCELTDEANLIKSSERSIKSRLDRHLNLTVAENAPEGS
ncbi:hypothetical protein [Mesorhizobium sp. KR9-304]|uniref:hypothetical protein n=1 Tax=Mesorhizobium sp. KR9-304 TaxID=3156614 RepID=UPI0032B5A3AE